MSGGGILRYRYMYDTQGSCLSKLEPWKEREGEGGVCVCVVGGRWILAKRGWRIKISTSAPNNTPAPTRASHVRLSKDTAEKSDTQAPFDPCNNETSDIHAAFSCRVHFFAPRHPPSPRLPPRSCNTPFPCAPACRVCPDCTLTPFRPGPGSCSSRCLGLPTCRPCSFHAPALHVPDLYMRA